MLSPIESPVSEELILICEKCSKSSRDLQSQIKKEIKAEGDSKKRRAVLTGCMNVCEKEYIAVAVAKVNGSTRFFTVDENFKDASKVLRQINEID